jgi:hypothetical protein
MRGSDSDAEAKHHHRRVERAGHSQLRFNVLQAVLFYSLYKLRFALSTCSFGNSTDGTIDITVCDLTVVPSNSRMTTISM